MQAFLFTREAFFVRYGRIPLIYDAIQPWKSDISGILSAALEQNAAGGCLHFRTTLQSCVILCSLHGFS